MFHEVNVSNMRSTFAGSKQAARAYALASLPRRIDVENRVLNRFLSSPSTAQPSTPYQNVFEGMPTALAGGLVDPIAGVSCADGASGTSPSPLTIEGWGDGPVPILR